MGWLERAGLESDATTRACLSRLDAEAPGDYRELAALLAHGWSSDPPTRVGLSGGQGAGKSTLGGLIEAACAHFGRRVCVLSLDDFYWSRSKRRQVARASHPLFRTRGPPGTHDVASLAACLEALPREGEVSLPVFDKSVDDRVGERRVRGPFDIVLLEGWCVGARAVDDAELVGALNVLEAERDPDGAWRRAVNRSLREDYEPVWDRLDARIHLQVPGLDAVRRWRTQQEQDHPASRRMGADEIASFVEHFERITLRMTREVADAVDAVDVLVKLGEEHRVESLTLRGRRLVAV